MKATGFAQFMVTDDGIKVLFDTPIPAQAGDRITMYLPKDIGERIGTVTGVITLRIEPDDPGQPEENPPTPLESKRQGCNR